MKQKESMDSDTNIRMMKYKINSTYELSKVYYVLYRDKHWGEIEIHSISEVNKPRVLYFLV